VGISYPRASEPTNVPASPQSPGTAGSIVLVEEYAALAVAIGSVLKKFAPGFTTRAFRSLAEAEAAIGDGKPDLLVVDFDPPEPGAFEFFTKLKGRAPSTRVLIIAAAPVGGLSGNTALPGAFQFVEKPFDLKTLGAGIEAVLQNAGSGERAHRTIRDLAVRDVVPLQCLASATAVLKIDSSEGRSGEVHFIDGQLSHAETTEVDGPAALEEMLRWRTPRFKQPKRRPRAARTLEGPWATIFAAALVGAADAEQQSPAAAPYVPEGRAKPVGGGKKVVVIDDTEMLLVFVEDSLINADPTLEITTAATGAEGVQRVQALRPDLVLLDYSLPDFNGDEVCKRLLAHPETATTPVIMMSGHVPEMAASAARYANVVATIAKPFRSEALLEITTKALAEPTQFAVRPPAQPALPPPPQTTPKPKPTAEPHRPANGNGRPTSTPEPLQPTSAPSAASAGAPKAVTTADNPAPPPNAPAAAAPPPARDLAPPPKISAPPSQPSAALQSAVVPPPPPIPVMAPAPAPVIRRAAPQVAVVESRAPAAIQPAPATVAAPVPLGVAPARIVATPTNTVVVGIPLEVLAIQFSPALQMAAIRARPASRTISLHVAAGAMPGVNLPETGFELGPVQLDGRGQMETIRLLPTAQRIGTIQSSHAFPVGGVSVLPWNGGKAVELTPTAAAPMLMHLAAPFELAGVELSPTFGVRALVLRARAGAIRVSLDRDGGRSGASFQTAQVLLNRSAEIAEILLDAVA
jgi:DNA-binding response OmpR family regulator